ncbi:TonB-dependent receptor [Paracoccus sp. SSJ]|uniref:TonB-dependent receptor n=1 Tax=Paracoccus sp. SSJ TaxID=3050636 RepID=UPI00254D4271|nr:TonB-dependent receptor [Paracoccus sp. SSJ]MDK8873355.1 TonB-dependent receptor [Paracoccus sp. SSJ]
MNGHKIPVLLGTVAMLALATAPALAQDNQGMAETLRLDEIVLTGEKQARSIKDTASSVAVLTTRDLEESGGQDSIADAATGIANVTYVASGGQGGAPTIRGQDSEGPNSGAVAFFGGTAPRLAFNLDGHYLGYNEIVWGSQALWDVESIEVFRGPQTATQGANSIAGAIIVKTKDPTFQPEGAAQLEYGSHSRRRASLMASGPLSEDLAGRIAVDYWARDNYIDYTNPDFAVGSTDQDHESRTIRAKLLWQPQEIPGLEGKLTFSHSLTNRPNWEAATEPYEDLESATASNPSWRLRTNTTILDVSYEFGNGWTLFNQLQYSDIWVKRSTEPVSAGTAILDQDVTSNETRVTFGTPEDRISGVAGLFVSRTDSDELLDYRGTTTYDDRKDSLGIFAETTWRLADRWSLTGGLRYQRDDITRRGVSSFTPNVLDYDESFDAWLPRIALAYDLDESTRIGAMISKGYNPGGVTLNLTSGEYVPFDAETSWNYEIFGRTRLLDDRLELTGNLFYTQLHDAQRYVVTSLPENIGSSITVNAERAKSYGLELGMDYLLRDNLRVKAGLGLLHTEISRFTSAAADYQGHRFGRSPDYTLSLAADWDITPEWRLSGQLRHTDGYYSDDNEDRDTWVDSYTVANARLTWQPRENLQAFAYVNNLFDDRSVTYLRASRSIGGFEATVVEPRELGIGLKMTF